MVKIVTKGKIAHCELGTKELANSGIEGMVDFGLRIAGRHNWLNQPTGPTDIGQRLAIYGLGEKVGKRE